MALYERLLGRTEAGGPSQDEKIPVHTFQAVMGERARGALATDVQARNALNSVLSTPLTPGEEQEALALLATITGTATARLSRAKEIDDVLLMGEAGVSGYTLPSQIETRLGV